ncbi:MAG TPA: 3'(2'),5'-bisphosphate nucleotidase CysQ, partial [Thioalkalivibrio sp.]|nr:3'(2'),5'-bisphosphate nucleotidase CysQ [Thioalkalivibrio sp.]
MTPDTDTLAGLLRQALVLAREAGVEILRVYREGFDVREKADKSPLTT